MRRATDPAAARLQVRRRLGIPKDTFLFTSFGYMYGSKGLEYLLRALPAVIAGTDKDVRLMFLGGRPRRPELERVRGNTAGDGSHDW